MKVLVACEFSGIVREAFRQRGHDAWSCDLLPTEIPGNHFEGDIQTLLAKEPKWDLMIAHPPCTYLASYGARWWKDKKEEQGKAVAFARWLYFDSFINKVCLENPIGRLSRAIRKPNQIIQPWQFGHGETKATCLWLKNLPQLRPTDIVQGREARIHKEPPGPNRWKNRSRTFRGVALAMAQQWG